MSKGVVHKVFGEGDKNWQTWMEGPERAWLLEYPRTVCWRVAKTVNATKDAGKVTCRLCLKKLNK